MADIIAVLILLILIGCAVGYIVKAKKSGVKCIGCPAGGSCPGSGKMPKKENFRDDMRALRNECDADAESN